MPTYEALVIVLGSSVIVGLGWTVIWFIRRERDGIAKEVDAVRLELEHSENRAKERHDGIVRQVAGMQTQLHSLRDSLPDRYVSKTDWIEFKGWLAGLLLRIESKIDHKADK